MERNEAWAIASTWLQRIGIDADAQRHALEHQRRVLATAFCTLLPEATRWTVTGDAASPAALVLGEDAVFRATVDRDENGEFLVEVERIPLEPTIPAFS